MRRVIVQMGMSLDGFVASDRMPPGGSVDEDDELVTWKLNRVAAAGAHLMGRVTYQEMSAYWPTSSSPYAAPMNDIPKVVFSRTLTEANWPTSRIVRGDLATEIAAIKQQSGSDVIAHGGAGFAASLASLGLVDEYCVAVQPHALGRGRGLFDRLPAALSLRLVEAKSFECGVVANVYQTQTG
jgi:dihydrofolate reductase